MVKRNGGLGAEFDETPHVVFLRQTVTERWFPITFSQINNIRAGPASQDRQHVSPGVDGCYLGTVDGNRCFSVGRRGIGLGKC